MGLMYLFPTEENESDHIAIDETNKTIILKSYGLPWIFWGYLASILVIIFAMYLAIREPLLKIKISDDLVNIKLAYLVELTLILTPLILLAFFFYEKIIIKSNNKIVLKYKIFFIPIFKKTLKLTSNESLVIDHFLESPNVAKLQNRPELKGFENKGYFELRAIVGNEKKLIDRHSRKQDLIKIKNILTRF